MRVQHLAIVIPALNEAATIATVIGAMRACAAPCCEQVTVLVGDNGSTDDTAAVAMSVGAKVVTCDRRGYGSACLAALAVLPADVDAVLFCDADGSDEPRCVPALLAGLAAADLVIGVRRAQEPGALTVPQRLGNALASRLLRWGYGVDSHDLGPFRVISRAALRRLRMDDRDFGWTVQMQARAARAGLRTTEVDVPARRRRGGVSKVSGSVRGSLLAGKVILWTLWRERGFNLSYSRGSDADPRPRRQSRTGGPHPTAQAAPAGRSSINAPKPTEL